MSMANIGHVKATTWPVDVVSGPTVFTSQKARIDRSAGRYEMLDRLREFFRGPAGMGVAGLLVLIGVVFAFVSVRDFGSTEAWRMAGERVFIDAATGKPFTHDLVPGEELPAKAPSGGRTGYPAEKCFWTKEGKPKSEPTYVLLNETKGVQEPTFCPDCGRLVVAHNPGAVGTPPPTKEEYAKRGGTRR